ncbi:MAG: phosphatidylserine decarboxylase [Planctomycetota bacterium]
MLLSLVSAFFPRQNLLIMSDTLALRALRFLPRNLISRAFGWIARRERPRFFVRPFMNWFSNRFGIDLTEAEKTMAEYPSLLALFTRRLKPGVRPIDEAPEILISPVDAAVGAFGKIDAGKLVQAKGLEYTVAALLGDDEEAAKYVHGSFLTLYLSPKDYHRIHTPREGQVTRTIYEPGTLWPVNRAAVLNVPSLFAVNERVTTFLDAPDGEIAVSMVGATNVGSIALAYDPLVSNCGGPRRDIDHRDQQIQVERGGDLGVFQLGSTVVLLIANPDFELNRFEPGQSVRLGTPIGKYA